MLTTLISTLTTPLRTIFSTTAPPCPYCRTLLSLLESERALNREILGLQPPTAPTSPPTPNVRPSGQESEAPLDVLEGLPESAKEALMREYEEFTRQSPKNMTVHPEVEEITPGQAIPLS
jgi:hypothetical protein